MTQIKLQPRAEDKLASRFDRLADYLAPPQIKELKDLAALALILGDIGLEAQKEKFRDHIYKFKAKKND